MSLKCLLLFFLCGLIEAADYSYHSHTRCVLPRITHGRVRIRQRSKLVKFMCSPRYELVGNRYATCVNGEWDTPIPICVRPGCPDLPKIPHGVQIKAHHDAYVVNFCLPGYKLQGPPAYFCDGSKWNISLFNRPTCVSDVEEIKASLSCDFEDENICGWMQDELHDFDWKRLNTKTPSAFLFTGPSYDHTYGIGNSGYYMYIESTSRLENDTARLLSPVYNASLAVDGCFSFFYHMFGKDVGGLRVYQKPDGLNLHEMLNQTDRQRYLLFEQWGNLGDTWYQAVPQLSDVGDDFQIVIEGIRGASFTSDIAIDDVAILQKENCTAARENATYPKIFSESCVGQCKKEVNLTSINLLSGQCGCSEYCLIMNNCCPDFVEVCVYDGSTEDDQGDVSSQSPELPQTQKLISESTTTESTMKTTTSTTTSTTKKTTTSTTTTTRKPTTTSTTTKKPETPKVTPKATTTETTTSTTKPTTKAAKVASSTTKKLATVATTVLPKVITKSISIDESKENEKMTLQKFTNDTPAEGTSSTWKTAIITIVVLALCVLVLFLGITYRGSLGLVTIARLRGRTTNDPEVRYLNSNDDDDL